MFENMQEDEVGSFIIEWGPKQTGLLGYRLWQLLKSSERSLSDAWAMAQECLRLRAALVNYDSDSNEYSISLDTACAGALAVKYRNPDLSEVEILSVLLYPLIDVLPAFYASRRDELTNGDMDADESKLWCHMDYDPGWLVLPASLLPVALSEMLAAYGLYLVDTVITAMKKKSSGEIVVERLAQAGECFGQAMFGAGDAYREQAVKQLASARAAVSAKIKHQGTPAAKQKRAILEYWNENPPTGLSADAAADKVPHEIGGLEIKLRGRTIADLLRQERKAGRLLK